MPLVGFTCPKDDSKRKFDYCFKECKEHCQPLPLLLSLSQHRDVVPNRYSVTEILNPPQVVYLQRNNDYYEYPQNLIWTTFGTAWHSVIEGQEETLGEMGVLDNYGIEEPFKKEIDIGGSTVTLTGRPDLYVKHTKTLWDFKTKKFYYDLKYLLERENWDEGKEIWQLNIYRVYKYPEAEKMKLCCLVKDWNRSVRDKYGVKPVEQLDVPWIDSGEVIKKVTELCALHMRCQENPETIPNCADEDVWINRNGVPLRCTEYCYGREFCPQFKERGK